MQTERKTVNMAYRGRSAILAARRETQPSLCAAVGRHGQEALGLLVEEPGESLSRGLLTSEMSVCPLHGKMKGSGAKTGPVGEKPCGRRAE